MKLRCKYTRLTDIPNINLELYKNIVNPMDYDFCLLSNEFYKIIGLSFRKKGENYLYIIDHNSNNDITSHLSILFDFTWQKIPSNWNIRMNEYHELEILPDELMGIDHWFERYIDEEDAVLSIIQKMI